MKRLLTVAKSILIEGGTDVKKQHIIKKIKT